MPLSSYRSSAAAQSLSSTFKDILVWKFERMAPLPHLIMFLFWLTGSTRPSRPTRTEGRPRRRCKYSFIYFPVIKTKGMCKLNEKSIGSVLFAFLGRDFGHIFGRIVSMRVETVGNTNFVASSHIQRERPCFRLTYVTQQRCCVSFLMMACALSLLP